MATESLVVVDASVAGEGWKGCDNCSSVVIVQEARGVVETVTTLPPSTKNHLCGPCIIGEIIARADHGRRTLKALYYVVENEK